MPAQQITKVTDGTFADDVLGSEVPILVDFWADWCQPCQLVAPVLEQLAVEQAGTMRIGKLNIDENPETTARYKVMSIPFMALFKDGAMVAAVVGAQPKESIWEQIGKYVV
ncbi:thioredoxin [Actinocatenispora sera]|uniref:Thioredoxin n=1 Tax=Actinocatenispora sera TaxID=390989 RepID=A0A810L3A8_9ACTN|nr:thioredoxin [Actinocatenispora sera]BCJ28638.1 thioredoxin [Actinocatenispora sera]